MSIPTNQSSKIAAKYAASPDVWKLFKKLSRRAGELVEMQAEFIEAIKRNRTAREGKAVRLTRIEKRTIREEKGGTLARIAVLLRHDSGRHKSTAD